MRRVVRGLIALTLGSQLSGCFFVFIPGSVIDAAVGAPKYCVGSAAKVGEKFAFNGATYEITELKGESPYYCREQPEGRRMGANAKVV